MKKALRTIAILALFILPGGPISLLLPDILYAFHSGGAGYCTGCHNLHNSQASGQETEEGGSSGPVTYLLRGSDASSTCLRCHAEAGAYYNIFSTDGSRYTPGGDFYWLKKTFTSVSNGKINVSHGDSHGHNVIAADYGLTQEQKLNSAPGGIYASSSMSCTSCHNPHGTIAGNASNGAVISGSGSYGNIAPQGTITGNYRLLGGVGYNGGNKSNGISFVYPAPVAVANASNWTETDSNHPAYGSGMSEWCANCHSQIMTGIGKHPVGNIARLSSSIIANYNAYVKTGDFRGSQNNSYLSLVPFELGTDDRSLLNPSSTSGPGEAGIASVMCLTCHRVHASAFPSIGRWDFKATFIADSHPKSGDEGVTGSDVLNSYYGRDITAQFGTYQRSFCNKCHVQD